MQMLAEDELRLLRKDLAD
jgi:hypothetical protein